MTLSVILFHQIFISSYPCNPVTCHPVIPTVKLIVFIEVILDFTECDHQFAADRITQCFVAFSGKGSRKIHRLRPGFSFIIWIDQCGRIVMGLASCQPDNAFSVRRAEHSDLTHLIFALCCAICTQIRFRLWPLFLSVFVKSQICFIIDIICIMINAHPFLDIFSVFIF